MTKAPVSKSDDELCSRFDKPREFFEHVALKSNLIDEDSDSNRLPDLENRSSSVLLGENLIKETMTVDPKEKTSSETVDNKMTNATICPEAHINEQIGASESVESGPKSDPCNNMKTCSQDIHPKNTVTAGLLRRQVLLSPTRGEHSPGSDENSTKSFRGVFKRAGGTRW